MENFVLYEEVGKVVFPGYSRWHMFQDKWGFIGQFHLESRATLGGVETKSEVSVCREKVRPSTKAEERGLSISLQFIASTRKKEHKLPIW